MAGIVIRPGENLEVFHLMSEAKRVPHLMVTPILAAWKC